MHPYGAPAKIVASQSELKLGRNMTGGDTHPSCEDSRWLNLQQSGDTDVLPLGHVDIQGYYVHTYVVREFPHFHNPERIHLDRIREGGG